MGEVYRARDPKLNRDVALKILPEAFANDPDRLTRFQREAQTLAPLNHPSAAAAREYPQPHRQSASPCVSADGSRFLLRQAAGAPAPPITVIVNWTDALAKRD